MALGSSVTQSQPLDCGEQAARTGIALPSVCIVGITAGVTQMLTGERPTGVGLRSDEIGVGGAERQVGTLGRLLRAQGWPVRFVVGDWGQTSDHTPDGIPLIVGYRYGAGLKGLRFLYPQAPMLWRALAEARADIYLARGVTAWSGLTALFCRRHRKRFVQALASGMDVDPAHTYAGPRDRWLHRQALRRADVVVAQHQEQADLLRQHYGREAQVIGNVVPQPTGPVTVAAGATPMVLWVANLKPLKRPEVVVEVARAIPEARFVMVGGPDPDHGGDQIAAWLREQMAAVPHLEYAGRLPPQQVLEYYRQAWVLLQTSRPGIEGFPNALLEAWTYGVPTVSSSRAGGIIEREGLGAYCETVPEMIAAVRHYLQASVPDRQRFAEHARRYMMEYHSPERVVGAYADLLAALGSA